MSPVAESEITVVVKDASVSFRGDVTALKDVSVALPAGQIIGLIGPSGAGKTTLIRAIVGRQKLTSGTITVFGLPAGSAKLRQQMSYMTQDVSVYSDLSVQENLRYFATMFGVARNKRAGLIRDLLKTVDMSNRAQVLVEHLSGGQKQRVSLAIALIGYPKVMVLDEPTVGLDPVLREDLWTLFRSLAASGTTLIISSHVMDEAERCDDLLLIRDAKLLAHDSPKELCRKTGSDSVEQSFLKLVRKAS